MNGNKKCVDKNDGVMITLTTRGDCLGVVVKDEEKQEINTSGLRIRKLTPKECFRLMGMKDEDIEKIMKHQTNAKAYHLAGDSIVTTCLMGIFGEMLGIDWKEKFNPKEWWKNE
jgi:site-specific DNA-cytosine methylase